MTDLVTVNEQAIERLGRAGVQRRDTALRRPLGEVVAETLQAACRSEHTRRAYETAMGLFLAYLGPAIDAPEEWLPLASCEDGTHESERGRTVHTTMWAYNGRAAVLAAVMPRRARSRCYVHRGNGPGKWSVGHLPCRGPGGKG